jgi:hypothetical protein
MDIDYYPRVISFSGRKQCGKTVLANICKRYGYEIINFADPMKELICEILNISRHELEEKKDTYMDIKLTYENLQYLMIKTQIDSNLYEKTEFISIREMLQTIGTNVIRKYNCNWHINKIRQRMDINKKYCFGDTRFNNEKNFLEELDAECWFIIRPESIFNINTTTNHISETELKWSDFNRNIIINDGKLEDMINRWERYLEIHENENINMKQKRLNETNMKLIRKKLIYLLNNYKISEITRDTKLKRTQLKWLCNKLLIYVLKSDNNCIFKNYTINDAYLFGQLDTNGYIKKDKHKCIIYFEHTNKKIVKNFKKSLNIKRNINKKNNNKKFYIECNNELIIENLKKWNIENLII